MGKEHQVLFREVQHFRQPLLWAVILSASGLMVGLFGYGMVRQLLLGRPWGSNPMPDTALLVVGVLAILFAVGFPLFFSRIALVTEVRRNGLYLRFSPFHRTFRQIPLEGMSGWEAVTYRPLREYGGWGIRYGLRGRAYNVSGRRGVRLTLPDGKHLLIGSQRPEALAEALEQADKTSG